MTESAAQQPLAQGDIAQTPAMHLFLYLQERQLQGTLVVASPTNQKSIVRFVEGRPVAGRFPHRADDLEQALLPICGYTSGAYAFFAADLLSPGPGIHEGVVDPYRLSSRSLRQFARDDVVEAMLTRYGDHPMRLQPGRPIDRLALEGREKGLLELLRASPDTVENLTKFSPLDRTMSRRVLYLLIVTKMVAPYREPASSKSHVRSKAPPTEATRASRPSMPAVVVERTEPTRPVTSPGQVSAVASLASLRPGSVRSMRPPPAATLETHVQDNDPDVRARRAQQRIASGQFDEAVEILEGLVQDFPDVARHHGTLAWALWERFRAEGASGETPSEVSEAIRQAHSLDPDESRAYYAKGLVFKHLGKDRNAYACFRRAINGEPHLLEAKREVRLLRRRLKENGQL